MSCNMMVMKLGWQREVCLEMIPFPVLSGWPHLLGTTEASALLAAVN